MRSSSLPVLPVGGNFSQITQKGADNIKESADKTAAELQQYTVYTVFYDSIF